MFLLQVTGDNIKKLQLMGNGISCKNTQIITVPNMTPNNVPVYRERGRREKGGRTDASEFRSAIFYLPL